MLRRLRDYARENGTKALVAVVWRHGRNFVYHSHKVTVVTKDLDDVVEPSKPMRDLLVERLEPRHLAGLSELNRLRDSPDGDAYFRDNLDRGLFGTVGLRDGKVVAYVWWVDRANASRHPDLDWLGDRVRLGDKDLYSSDTYVLPEHRGGGTATALLYGTEVELREAGYARAFAFIDHGNTAAERFWAKRGWVPREALKREWIFGRERVRSVAG